MTETVGEYAEEKNSKQINITLGPQVRSDFEELAEYQGRPLATLLSQMLEEQWRNPGTQKLIERAKQREHISDRQPRKTTKHGGR